MIVSPGHEADGIMHMPTGQSGHPLSPFYSNSHEAWVNGEADAVPAGADGVHPDADAVILNCLCLLTDRFNVHPRPRS